MPEKLESNKAPTTLRRRAEKQVSATQPASAAPRSETDVRRLLHELEVHQIELETPNHELRASHG